PAAFVLCRSNDIANIDPIIDLYACVFDITGGGIEIEATMLYFAITLRKSGSSITQSALFSPVVSDIVLINMWFHDIGRQQAANKPLLKTVFWALPENLEPVLREELDPALREDIQKVEVVALSSFEEKEEQFKEQFQRQVFPSVVNIIWKIIKENKDLYLPAHKVMMATVCCKEIANKKCGSFLENEEWRELEETVQWKEAWYDAEATYFDEGVRTGKRKQLEEKLLQLVQPAFQLMLGHIWSGTLERFKEAFNDALNGGKGFAITACQCIETSISQVEEWLSQRQKKKLGGFSTLFSHDTDSMLRVWTWKEDIRAIIKTARSSALKLLSVLWRQYFWMMRWCHDIGRQQAANKRLLKTVFQIWNSVPKPQAHKETLQVNFLMLKF
ncbi:hypothetical protein ACH5RR_006011, partial [Cinchona calisaya]